MVEEQLIPRGIESEAVLDAMRDVPRHLFVPQELQSSAYADSPLPIGAGQTISQPYIVAYMTEVLEPTAGMTILEIGTGSGYQAAILAYLGCEVYTIEILEELYTQAKQILSALGYNNINMKLGSGYSGWSEQAPFDAIIVTAAPEYVPDALIEQLRIGGKMVIPVGSTYSVQQLKLIERTENGINETNLLPVRFVPMV